MNTIISALLNLMSNPTTSGILLAALIGSNALMFSENSELERSNRQIAQQLSKVTAQLEKLVALQQTQPKQRSDNWKKEKAWMDNFKKQYDAKPWIIPRE